MTNPPPPDPVALAPEDRSLLQGCLSARTGAWDAFVDRFAGLFAFVAARTARQRGLALGASDRDDLVADILVECLRNDAAALRSFAGRSSLATYLTVIARRVTARRLAEVVSSPPSPTSARHRRSLDPLAAVVDDAARLADREHIESLLGALDPDEARLVRLHHLEQRSYGEISHLTGMPLNSIGPALSRAREKMRKQEQQAG